MLRASIVMFLIEETDIIQAWGREIISETLSWEVAEPGRQLLRRQSVFLRHYRCLLLEVQEEG